MLLWIDENDLLDGCPLDPEIFLQHAQVVL